MQQEETITAQEAAKAFLNAGLSEPTFRRRVSSGKIAKFGEGLYSKNDVVNAIAETVNKRANSKRLMAKKRISTSTQFMRASIEDMPAIALLIEEAFNTFPNIERWQAWMQRNPDIAYVLKCEGQIVGCGFILPLSEDKIRNILTSEVTPPTLPEEIEVPVAGQPVTLYVRTVAVKRRNVNRKLSALWGERLILALQNIVIGFGARGIVIERLYSRSDTNMGRRTLRLLGFTEIPTITSHHNYMIDVASSGLSMIHRYREALNRWRIQYEDA